MFRTATMLLILSAASAFAEQPQNVSIPPRIAVLEDGSISTNPESVAEYEAKGRRQEGIRILVEAFAGATPIAEAYLGWSQQARSRYQMEQWLKSADARMAREAMHRYWLNNPSAVITIGQNGNGAIPAANPKK